MYDVKITFGVHYPTKTPGCVICSSPTTPGVYVCSSCNFAQLRRINEVPPEQREQMEEEEVKYISRSDGALASSYNISSLTNLIARSPRWIWNKARLSSLAPGHDGHQAVWTWEQGQHMLSLTKQKAPTVFACDREADGTPLVMIERLS